MMRKWRERDFERGDPPATQRLALRLWAFAAKRPRLYHALSGTIVPLLARLAGDRGRFSSLPFADAWTETRDLRQGEGQEARGRGGSPLAQSSARHDPGPRPRRPRSPARAHDRHARKP